MSNVFSSHLRHYYSHLPLPQDHCEGGRYSYLSSSPRDTVDIGLQVTLKTHTQLWWSSWPGKPGKTVLKFCWNKKMKWLWCAFYIVEKYPNLSQIFSKLWLSIEILQLVITKQPMDMQTEEQHCVSLPLFYIMNTQDSERTGRGPREQNCLMGCCNPNLEEPNGCHSQVSQTVFRIECLSHAPPLPGHGTNFLLPFCLCPCDNCDNLKANFSCKETKILSSNSKVKPCFLWDRSVNYMSRLRQYTSSVQTWPSARQISQRFSRRGGKVLKEVIINQLMLRAAATRRGS